MYMCIHPVYIDMCVYVLYIYLHTYMWEVDAKGDMRWRDMNANDVPIAENERRL